MFIPFFSGITDTAPAYHLDGDTYNPDGAFWKFKSICTIAEQNRSLYSQGVKDFWKLQEELMYQEMLDAALVIKGRNGSVYDTFRGRVIFPIIDLRGNGGGILQEA